MVSPYFDQSSAAQATSDHKRTRPSGSPRQSDPAEEQSWPFESQDWRTRNQQLGVAGGGGASDFPEHGRRLALQRNVPIVAVTGRAARRGFVPRSGAGRVAAQLATRDERKSSPQSGAFSGEKEW